MGFVKFNENGYFLDKDGKTMYLVGVNFSPRSAYGSFWKEGWEPESLCRDLDQIQSMGLNGIRFPIHWYAFEPEEGKMDTLMLERLDWNFIMDTYWVEFAGKKATDYIQKIGGERLPNIHFKDMAKDEERSICPCGNGVLNFREIFEVCQKVGVKHVLVEQDNAVKSPDAFADMETSFRHLRPIIR